ncbi:hypothetical protein [Tautonia sociabilis]|uniref:Glycoside hydrolase family 42 N-terminal domain-containing protein n=1 Tax=Tautonia sociabilis TaxID=2080755 RepID=A0A432MPD5_9BACT|nr:hypothetical protein [Tautonia sociabilis]RUL89294.1 hypothetical protein TsocGM_02420 [Tautonia sociabilis]
MTRTLPPPRSLVGPLVGLMLVVSAGAQRPDALIVRPGPPPLIDFEADEDGDGVPDGWYNLRDAALVPEGGVVGPTLLRFEADLPSRPARISRGFGVDGRQTEALILGLWVRRVGDPLLPGERLGEEPSVLLDLLDADLRSTARGSLGPFTDLPDGRWVHWVARIPVPPDTRDVLMTVGLLGGTGTLDVDGLTIEEVPVGGASSTNLVVNGNLELGGLDPDYWLLEGQTRRVHPGRASDSALELSDAGDRALAPLGVPVGGMDRLSISIAARGEGLRGAGGAQAVVFFLGDDGQPIPGPSAARAVRWAGSFGWRVDRATIPVPPAAVRAVLQLEKLDRLGAVRVDDVEVVGEARVAGLRSWTPFHVEGGGDSWPPYEPAEAVEAGSALDASVLLDTPAGSHGFVSAEGGRLRFEDGSPARFFGIYLFPPVMFAQADRTDALADRLARSGVNLVYLGDLDTPLGPGSSLLDDTVDDTSTLDPLVLADFDHFVAALKARGISIALGLLSQARFRANDSIADFRALPPGGGPAAAFDPNIRDRTLRFAEALLTHVNPETGLALKDDPVLAWVTLAGEHSLFDLIDQPDALPPRQAEALRERSRAARRGAGRAFWQVTEAEQWSAMAARLREIGLRVPIAGSSHFRREPEFAAAQRAEGLDLIDDRLFWPIPRFAAPDLRSLLRRPSAELVALAEEKRDRDRPYVVGQYAHYTEGAWALPWEGPDLLFAAVQGRASGWDALVRRGIGRFPEVWGAAASGTGGGQDVFLIPEVINGNPQVFAMLPHASALFRGEDGSEASPGTPPGSWDRRLGRLMIDTRRTIGVAGAIDEAQVSRDGLGLRSRMPVGAIVASSVGAGTLAEADRILVSAVARVQPTGLEWVDHWRREVADPGRPPLRVEPIRATVSWTREGPASLFALDEAGRRIAEIPGKRTPQGMHFDLDGRDGRLHWELVVGSP